MWNGLPDLTYEVYSHLYMFLFKFVTRLLNFPIPFMLPIRLWRRIFHFGSSLYFLAKSHSNVLLLYSITNDGSCDIVEINDTLIDTQIWLETSSYVHDVGLPYQTRNKFFRIFYFNSCWYLFVGFFIIHYLFKYVW